MSVRKRFINSLIYPAFLILLSLVMVAVIMTFVIPKFADLYRDLNVELPLPQRF
jgi:type IV pilus assembly protein PilC